MLESISKSESLFVIHLVLENCHDAPDTWPSNQAGFCCSTRAKTCPCNRTATTRVKSRQSLSHCCAFTAVLYCLLGPLRPTTGLLLHSGAGAEKQQNSSTCQPRKRRGGGGGNEDKEKVINFFFVAALLTIIQYNFFQYLPPSFSLGEN